MRGIHPGGVEFSGVLLSDVHGGPLKFVGTRSVQAYPALHELYQARAVR